MECITHCHCISHLITSFHHILHCIIPHQRPFLTFQTAPHPHSSPYHTSTSRSTLFHFALPYFKSHRIGHIMHHTTSRIAPYFTSSCVPHNTTLHVLHATFHIPPYIGHIMHRPTTSRITPHFTHCTAFHMPLHILHSCIIPPHLTVITPSYTSHYHISHNISHHISVHHHILHPTTYHMA